MAVEPVMSANGSGLDLCNRTVRAWSYAASCEANPSDLWTDLCKHVNETIVKQSKCGDVKQERPSEAEKWGYGLLFVLLVSVSSVVGVFFLPLMKSASYKKVLMGMVGLGVGCLCGSAVLHLIPQAFQMPGKLISQKNILPLFWFRALISKILRKCFRRMNYLSIFYHCRIIETIQTAGKSNKLRPVNIVHDCMGLLDWLIDWWSYNPSQAINQSIDRFDSNDSKAVSFHFFIQTSKVFGVFYFFWAICYSTVQNGRRNFFVDGIHFEEGNINQSINHSTDLTLIIVKAGFSPIFYERMKSFWGFYFFWVICHSIVQNWRRLFFRWWNLFWGG